MCDIYEEEDKNIYDYIDCIMQVYDNSYKKVNQIIKIKK